MTLVDATTLAANVLSIALSVYALAKMRGWSIALKQGQELAKKGLTESTKAQQAITEKIKAIADKV